jgi:hypothetical protein
MKLTDEQLSDWTKPPFDKEEEMAEVTKDRIQVAVDNYLPLKNLSPRVFAKGSYKNRTNVRHKSDIDVGIELTSLYALELPKGLTVDSIQGISRYDGIPSLDFKRLVGEAMKKEFGNKVDDSGNKVFKIRGSSVVSDADIVPCTTHRQYFSDKHDDYRQGIKLILNTPDGIDHVNYPDQHYNNGIVKNDRTKMRYKNVVRILKNINGDILGNGKPKYHSSMIESIAYNINSITYQNNGDWRALLKALCSDAWIYIDSDEPGENDRWTEVDGIKFLFHTYQKWGGDHAIAKDFIQSVYNLL